jgi:hypothetical protein
MLLLGLLALMVSMPFIGGRWNNLANSPRVSGKVSYVEKLSDQPIFGISNAKHNVTALMRIFSNDSLGA